MRRVAVPHIGQPSAAWAVEPPPSHAPPIGAVDLDFCRCDGLAPVRLGRGPASPPFVVLPMRSRMPMSVSFISMLDLRRSERVPSVMVCSCAVSASESLTNDSARLGGCWAW